MKCLWRTIENRLIVCWSRVSTPIGLFRQNGNRARVVGVDRHFVVSLHKSPSPLAVVTLLFTIPRFWSGHLRKAEDDLVIQARATAFVRKTQEVCQSYIDRIFAELSRPLTIQQLNTLLPESSWLWLFSKNTFPAVAVTSFLLIWHLSIKTLSFRGFSTFFKLASLSHLLEKMHTPAIFLRCASR